MIHFVLSKDETYYDCTIGCRNKKIGELVQFHDGFWYFSSSRPARSFWSAQTLNAIGSKLDALNETQLKEITSYFDSTADMEV